MRTIRTFLSNIVFYSRVGMLVVQRDRSHLAFIPTLDSDMQYFNSSKASCRRSVIDVLVSCLLQMIYCRNKNSYQGHLRTVPPDYCFVTLSFFFTFRYATTKITLLMFTYIRRNDFPDVEWVGLRHGPTSFLLPSTVSLLAFANSVCFIATRR